MKFDRAHIREYLELYLVSDRYWLSGRELHEDVSRAIEGGVTFVQIREKDMEHEAFMKEARKLKHLCEEHEIPFVVNDDVMVAKAIDADGVHVGQSDESAKKAREVLGDEKIIGVSVQTVEDAICAQKDGADYLGVGALFSTTTKKDADRVSLETLKAICEAVSIPVIAIGGICAHNLLELKGSGIDGVAVVSAIMAKENIYQTAKLLRIKTKELLQ